MGARFAGKIESLQRHMVGFVEFVVLLNMKHLVILK